jgi:hypothetical protein
MLATTRTAWLNPMGFTANRMPALMTPGLIRRDCRSGISHMNRSFGFPIQAGTWVRRGRRHQTKRRKLRRPNEARRAGMPWLGVLSQRGRRTHSWQQRADSVSVRSTPSPMCRWRSVAPHTPPSNRGTLQPSLADWLQSHWTRSRQMIARAGCRRSDY